MARRLAFFCVLLELLVATFAHAEPPAAASQPPSEAELLKKAVDSCRANMVFVYPVDDTGAPGNERLAQLVAETVLAQLRSDRIEASSAYEIHRRDQSTVPALQDLQRWKAKDTEKAIQSQLPNRKPLVGLVDVTLARVDTEYQARLTLACRHVAVATKLVRASASSERVLLDRVRLAVGTFFGSKAVPGVVVRGGMLQLAAPGDAVVLDASTSSDPEFDEFSYEWTVPEGVAKQDSGPSLTLFPVLPGDYPVQLQLKQVLPEASSKPVTITVRVQEKLRVEVGEDRAMTFASPKAQLPIDGRCFGAAKCEWVQVAGPVVELPACTMDGVVSGSGCTIAVVRPGEYDFELVASRERARVRGRQRFFVWPKPNAWISGPAQGILGRSIRFNGSASLDVNGAPLAFHWEVSDAPTAEGDIAPIPGHSRGAWLSAPGKSITEFVADRPGTYSVRLCVTSEHSVEKHVHSFTDCQQQGITINDPNWYFFLGVGGAYRSRDAGRWSGLRVSVGGVVRFPGSDRFGLRGEQVVVKRSDDRWTGMGGTLIGGAWIANDFVHPHISAYARLMGEFALGGVLGLDFHVRRWLAVTGYGGCERTWRSAVHSENRGLCGFGKFEVIVAGTVGVGYDL